MEIDQSVLDSMPMAQRQRLLNQLRREQVRRYNDWFKRNPVSERNSRLISYNKKGASVQFELGIQLSDADTCYDDRQVLELLNKGVSPNLANAAGITLLHKCSITDSLSVAEILINHGADVNAQDQDLWTPLHCACECNNVDIAALLLANGADPLLLDVDDNLPVDHTTIDSPIRPLLDQHLHDHGGEISQYTILRKSRAKSMLADIKELIETPGATVSLPNEDGTTLLHIACANGYKEVAKVLIANRANLSARDNNGMTPLHVAAKFNQAKMVQLLIKHLADPTILDDLGRAPVDVTLNEYIVGRLVEYERERPPGSPPPDPIVEIEEGIYDFELEAPREPTKSVSPDINISKVEELMEAKQRLSLLNAPPGTPEPVEESPEGEIYEEDSSTLAFGKKPPSGEKKAELPQRIDTDDLISLPEISEDIILKALSKRYNENRIYTCIGDILIAVNPFQTLPIHQRSISHKYNQADVLATLPAHTFATAERAYRAMNVEKHSQCCIVSGESGAGKTESSKYLIQHLLTVATSDETNLNARIEQVNPLLEAFGNAQTVMNDNSSRFGKYLEVMFSEEGTVQGAKIYEYLLEKSRVVYQSPNETNFHIFYLMYAGTSPDEQKRYQLGAAKSHRYLRSLGDQIDTFLGPDSLEKFTELRDCLRFIGFTSEDVDNLFISLSAVLHLGDVTFKPVGNNDSAQISNCDVLEKVASLLQVPAEDLSSSLEAEITLTRGEYIRKERSMAQAADCRDALSKSIYSRLFSWIVNSINQLIQPLDACSVYVEIGILDIFGFENFPKNSFEQICINLANEQLQFLFNKGIFESELNDCKEEGLSITDLHFTSNTDIIEMFLSKPQGILAVLDEQSRFPKATDQSLATKLHDGPGRTFSKRYMAPKDRGTTFAILHYAGHVVYQLDGVLEKNKETLPASILFTMKTSNSLVIKEMFRSRLTRVGSLAPSTRQRRSRKGKKGAFQFLGRQRSAEENKPLRKKVERPAVGTDRKGPSTAAYHFKNSLADLMSKMSSASPHFIRCLKPNVEKVANNFNRDYVRSQLLYTGILQTVEIRKQGFPLRTTFQDFLSRYELLASRHIPLDSKLSDLDKCKTILKRCDIQDYRVGKTKLFLRFEGKEILSQLTEEMYRRIVLIQTAIRSWISQMHCSELEREANQQKKTMESFLNNIGQRCEALNSKMSKQKDHDAERQEQAEKEAEKQRVLEEQDKRLRELEEEKRVSRSNTAKSDGDRDFDIGGGFDDSVRGKPSRASIGIRRTDEISQSLLALDEVIDQYDPYRLSTHNNNLGELKVDPHLANPQDDDDNHSNDSRNEEIRKSIEALDSVLDAYDDESSSLETSDSNKRSSQVSMRGQTQKSPQSGLLRHPRRSKTEESDDLPPPPPELLHDGGRPHSIHSTSGSELYARSSKRNSRAPPQVPKRNPETRLSSGSSESQELDVSRFALQDVSGLDSGYGTEQDYPQKPGYPGHNDGYYGETNGDVAYHGQQHQQQQLGGAPPPKPPIPPGASIPPPLPPGGGRNSIDGGHMMPPYYSHQQHQQQHHTQHYQDTNGLESIVPPPPPGFDMGANVSAPGEELYETKLPPRMDTMPPQTIETHYGAQLPQPGMDNGYPSPHELYETTLPRPMGLGFVDQRGPPPPVLRRGSSSSSGSNKNSYSSGSTRDTSIGPEYSLSTPVPAPSMASPDSDFPPPPPPQFFNNIPSAPSSAPGSGPGSPVRPPPPTLPKPKGKTSQPPTPPLNGVPPPPPMMPNTMPRMNHNHVNAPPTPPPLSTLPRAPPAQNDANKLAQELANVTLRSSPEDKPSKSSSINAHSDLISQIHIGVALRKSPAGKKIRGSDELGPRVEDNGDSFSETASVTSSGSGEDYSGSSTGSRPPPPTLPKPNKPSPIHTNTMPSGGSQTNNTAPAPDDFDPYDGEDGRIYEKIVDVTQVDGYQDVPEDCPSWKKAMIERKNKQLEEQMRRQFNDQKAEEDKWRGVPDWKKNLIKEKEKKRGDELAPQEEAERRRMEEDAKLAGMPEWKRNLLLKKRGDI